MSIQKHDVTYNNAVIGGQFVYDEEICMDEAPYTKEKSENHNA